MSEKCDPVDIVVDSADVIMEVWSRSGSIRGLGHRRSHHHSCCQRANLALPRCHHLSPRSITRVSENQGGFFKVGKSVVETRDD